MLCVAGLSAIAPINRASAGSQGIYIAVGIAIFYLVERTHIVGSGGGRGFYILCLLLLIYMMVACPERHGFLCVPRINGYRSWIDLKILTLQPAELTKIAFVMLLARYLRFRSNYRTAIGLLPPMAWP